jgi:hypothetical protein
MFFQVEVQVDHSFLDIADHLVKHFAVVKVSLVTQMGSSRNLVATSRIFE